MVDFIDDTCVILILPRLLSGFTLHSLTAAKPVLVQDNFQLVNCLRVPIVFLRLPNPPGLRPRYEELNDKLAYLERDGLGD